MIPSLFHILLCTNSHTYTLVCTCVFFFVGMCGGGGMSKLHTCVFMVKFSIFLDFTVEFCDFFSAA